MNMVSKDVKNDPALNLHHSAIFLAKHGNIRRSTAFVKYLGRRNVHKGGTNLVVVQGIPRHSDAQAHSARPEPRSPAAGGVLSRNECIS